LTLYVLFYSVPDNSPSEALYYRGHYFVCITGPNPAAELYYAYYDGETNELLHKSHTYHFDEVPEGLHSWMHDPCGAPMPDIYPKTKLRFVIYVRFVGEEWYEIVDDVFDVTYDGLKGQGEGNPVRFFHVGLSRYRFENPTPCLDGKPVVGIHFVFEQDEEVERRLKFLVKDLETDEIVFGTATFTLRKKRDTAYAEIKGTKEQIHHYRAEVYVDDVLSDFCEFEFDGAKTSPILQYPAEEQILGTVMFSGSVSAQVKEGEIVTIEITRPDGTIKQVTTTTNEDLTFNTDYSDEVGKGYKAKARIEEDALYTAAESEEVVFDIKATRTITLTVKPK